MANGKLKPPTSGSVLMMVSGFIVIILLTAAFTVWQVHQSQSQWCDTMRLLTSHPVPAPSNAAANPSRENAYRFYSDFKMLKERLGC